MCSFHHKEIHSGRYNGTKLNKLQSYDSKDIKEISHESSFNSKSKKIFNNSKRTYVKKLKCKFGRLKIKGITNNLNSSNPLRNHNILTSNVNTNIGEGIKATPITHHSNRFVNKVLHYKHVINDYIKNGINYSKHPIGKTGTFSNKAYFIPIENYESSDEDTKIEIASKNGLLKRVDNDNLRNHYNEHLKSSESLKHILDESDVIEIRNPDENEVDECVVDDKNNCIEFTFKNNNNGNYEEIL